MTHPPQAIWFTFRDKQVLFARKRGMDRFICIGGKVEPHETPHEAVVREVFEETTVALVPSTVMALAHFQALPHPRGGTFDCTAYTAMAVGQPTPTNEIEELRWLDSSHMDLGTPASRIILRELHENGLIA